MKTRYSIKLYIYIFHGPRNNYNHNANIEYQKASEKKKEKKASKETG